MLSRAGTEGKAPVPGLRELQDRVKWQGEAWGQAGTKHGPGVSSGWRWWAGEAWQGCRMMKCSPVFRISRVHRTLM